MFNASHIHDFGDGIMRHGYQPEPSGGACGHPLSCARLGDTPVFSGLGPEGGMRRLVTLPLRRIGTAEFQRFRIRTPKRSASGPAPTGRYPRISGLGSKEGGIHHVPRFPHDPKTAIFQRFVIPKPERSASDPAPTGRYACFPGVGAGRGHAPLRSVFSTRSENGHFPTIQDFEAAVIRARSGPNRQDTPVFPRLWLQGRVRRRVPLSLCETETAEFQRFVIPKPELSMSNPAPTGKMALHLSVGAGKARRVPHLSCDA